MAYDLMKKRRSGRDWSLGSVGAPLTTSTQDVDVKISALITDTNNLNADISQWMKSDKAKKNPKSGAFWAAWVAWREETTKFIQSWKQGWSLKLAWNFYDNAADRLNELGEWRRRWESLSGETATGPASKPPAPSSEQPSVWKWVALAGAGAVGALLLAKKIGA